MKLIHGLLKRRPYTSLEFIRSALMQQDENVSIRTIQRDIENMKTCDQIGYHAPIEYHRGQNGYYYTKADYELLSEVSVKAAMAIMVEVMERYLNSKEQPR
jgi:predicted DNA-binding transcriptional regulator YafY